MMATGAVEEVVEVGYFGAGRLIPCDELSAGMVGYITASIKNVRDTRVGDTVTDADRPCAEALPGHEIQIVLTLQALLNNFQVKQSKETAAEAKAECCRCLRLVEEGCIV